jgi:hypothetical protein
MAKAKTAPYPGILGKPLKWRVSELLRTPRWARGAPADWERRAKAAVLADARDFFECFMALLRHFKIDPAEAGAEIGLALALAGAPPVPAFTAPSRRGAPPKLGPLDTIRLVVACDECDRLVAMSHARWRSRCGRKGSACQTTPSATCSRS